MKTRVEVANYENLFPFVLLSSDERDFDNRMMIFACVVIDEFEERLMKQEAMFSFQVTPVIDKMNEEVFEIVEKINNTQIINNQQYVMNPLLLRILEAKFNPVFNAYCFDKQVKPN